MIDKNKVVESAFETINNNEDWKQVLMDAPPGAQLRICIAFYGAKNKGEWERIAKDSSLSADERSEAQKSLDEYREFREQFTATLNAFDLKYLAENFERMGLESGAQAYREAFEAKPEEERKSASEQYAKLIEDIKARREANEGEDIFSWMGDDGEAEQESGEQEQSLKPSGGNENVSEE